MSSRGAPPAEKRSIASSTRRGKASTVSARVSATTLSNRSSPKAVPAASNASVTPSV